MNTSDQQLLTAAVMRTIAQTTLRSRIKCEEHRDGSAIVQIDGTEFRVDPVANDVPKLVEGLRDIARDRNMWVVQ